jgi:septum formation protein
MTEQHHSQHRSQHCRPRSLILASASPARRRLLADAGIDPVVIVSGVDESAASASSARDLVVLLATAKADAVARRLADHEAPGALVLGCDSMLDFDGETLGKPGTPDAAVERWKRMRGRSGVLLTGHCLIDVATGRQVSDVAATTVRFGEPSDDEIAAYVATGEPLEVAGAFTLDGRAAPFIDGIDGDASNVIGLSLPLLRRLLASVDVGITELWR